jgi:hypothetical protein
VTDAFYQLDTSRNTKWQWLGLALVKKIVDISWWSMDISAENHLFQVVIHFR